MFLPLPRGLPRQPNMVIFNEVMNSKDKFALSKLSKFSKEILAKFEVIHSNI